VPWLESLTQLELDCRAMRNRRTWETKFEVRREPIGLEADPFLRISAITSAKSLFDEVRHQETIVQLGAPAHQSGGGVRLAPEPAPPWRATIAAA